MRRVAAGKRRQRGLREGRGRAPGKRATLGLGRTGEEQGGSGGCGKALLWMADNNGALGKRVSTKVGTGTMKLGCGKAELLRMPGRSEVAAGEAAAAGAGGRPRCCGWRMAMAGLFGSDRASSWEVGAMRSE